MDYLHDPRSRQALPAVRLSVQFSQSQVQPILVDCILDTGADASAFDGLLALAAGWAENDIIERAQTSRLIHGIGSGRAIRAYLHEVVCSFGAPMRYAQLHLQVFITPPNSLAFSVLGRRDFFQQVDVTFAEFDKKLYFRFHDPSLVREA